MKEGDTLSRPPPVRLCSAVKKQGNNIGRSSLTLGRMHGQADKTILLLRHAVSVFCVFTHGILNSCRRTAGLHLRGYLHHTSEKVINYSPYTTARNSYEYPSFVQNGCRGISKQTRDQHQLTKPCFLCLFTFLGLFYPTWNSIPVKNVLHYMIEEGDNGPSTEPPF